MAQSTDARGNTTKTSYTPVDGGPITSQTITDALGHTSSKTFDPGRGSVLSSTDVSGYLTTATYDPLGRATAVWKPGRSQSSGASASVTYAYQDSQSAPLATTTRTLVDYGTGTSYLTSVSISDSLGHARQTQTQAEGGDTVITDTFYDSHGWAWETDNKSVISGSPSTVIATVTPSEVNDRTVTSFDADGRPVLQKSYNGTTQTGSTQTVYSGDSTTAIKHDASGTMIGTPSTVVKDADGRTVATEQYTAAPSVNANVVTQAVANSMQSTATKYDALGRKIQVQDPDGNDWTYQYDLLGRLLKSTDPDTGTTVSVYDANGNVASTTDANGTEDNYVYDALNRKSAEYTGSTTQGSGTKIATWVYDSLKPGKLSYETSINPATGVVYESGNLGYDSYGDITGTWVVVPSSATGLAGTYKTTYTYSSSGLMLTDTPPTVGGLPADALTFTYDTYGNPVKDTGYDVYASSAVYTPYGEISQIDLGTGPSAAALTYSYDSQTRQEDGVSLSDTQPVPQVDSTTYTFNADRQLVSATDTEGASGTAPVETQCFTYDIMNRLTAAWTATDSCASNPFTSGSNATVGGPQPYAQSWSYNAAGDRTSETDLPAADVTTGTNTTSYAYTTAGHAHSLTSTTTTNSVSGAKPAVGYTYDNVGDTKTRASGAETLAWDANDRLSTDTNSVGTTSFVYDADGNRLVESDPGGTSTLFLPDEQVTYNSSTKASSGVRFYKFDGVTVAESNGSALYWLEGNSQSTMSVAVNAFSQNTVVRRAMTPYGAPASGSQTWIDGHGFMGDVVQSAAGLVNVGAREYDPSIGAFISVDPVLEAGDARQINGYSYAADNPANSSDPSGDMAMMIDDGNGDIGSLQAIEAMEARQCDAACQAADAAQAAEQNAAFTAAESDVAAGDPEYLHFIGTTNKSGGNAKLNFTFRETKEYTLGDPNNPADPYIKPSAEGQGLSSFETPEEALAAYGGNTADGQVVVMRVPVSTLRQYDVSFTEDGGQDGTPQGHVTIGFNQGLTQDQANGMKGTLQSAADGPELNTDGSVMTKANYTPLSQEQSDEAADALNISEITQQSQTEEAAAAQVQTQAIATEIASQEQAAMQLAEMEAFSFAEAEMMAEDE